MKIKFLLMLVLLSMLMISCSRDEDFQIIPDNETVVSKVSLQVICPWVWNINPEVEKVFDFSYDSSQRLTKKMGGLLTSSSSAGGFEYFSDLVYTSLVYNDNKVTVENFSISTDFAVYKNSKYFTMNGQNQIETNEVPSIYNNLNDRKDFYYYKNGKLDEIVTTFPNRATDPIAYLLTYSEKFYYNSIGNLERTEYFEQINGVNNQNPRVRYFENYDSAYNPFKKLALLDEYFYRSLSKNNYRGYREVSGGVLTGLTKWVFNYDNKGNLILQ